MVEEPVPRLGPVPWTVGDNLRGIGVALIAAVVILLLLAFVAVVIAIRLLGVEGLQELGSEGLRQFLGSEVFLDWFMPVGLALSLLFQGALFFGAWRFSVSKYRCGWQALGFRSFDIKRGLIMVAIVVAACLAVSVLYGMLMTYLGIADTQSSPLPVDYTMSGPSLGIYAFLVVGVAPFVEEAFFRGFIFSGFGKRFGYGWGAVVSAVLFSLVHLVSYQPATLVPIFLLGLLLAWLYWRTRSLWACILTHLAYNSIALLFMILFGW